MSSVCLPLMDFARTFLFGFAVCLAAGCSPVGKPVANHAADNPFTEAGENAAATITADQIVTHVKVLGSDEFEGRSPASRGDRLTQAYLIEQLAAAGYMPAGVSGTWLQPFKIVGIDTVTPRLWTFSLAGQQQDFAHRDEYVAVSGVQADTAIIEDAEVVFVGYGIQAPEYDWDDFKGRDLSGKVLLMLNNDPEWDPELFAGERRLYYGRWVYKFESAALQGAAGAIIIHTTSSAGYPWQVVETGWTGEQFELPAAGEPRSQVEAWMTEAAAGRLVAMAGKDLAALAAAARSHDFEPVPLGVTTAMTLNNTITDKETANVLGILPGSDPELAGEVVILTAHHDHLGIGEPDASGDRIYNGAEDNGMGMGMVLAIANAYASMPVAPRRSMLMLFVAAEEQGLLGSRFYADNPTFPAGHIAANMNYDGGNIWGRTRDITFIGYGKSTLDSVVDLVAARQGRIVKPDQFPDRGYYYRSDQISFAKIGVPATYFDKGMDFIGRPADWGRRQIEEYEAVRYHQPSDEYDESWNLEGAVEDVRLGFWVGLIVANADEMPAWSPGDEFEAARKAALDALME